MHPLACPEGGGAPDEPGAGTLCGRANHLFLGETVFITSETSFLEFIFFSWFPETEMTSKKCVEFSFSFRPVQLTYLLVPPRHL